MPGEATPGQAAREAFGELGADWYPGTPWNGLHEDLRAQWEAAAQAAIAAAPPWPLAMACTARDGDTVVIAFRERVSQEMAADLRDRWASHAPGVKVIVLDDADEAASYRRDNDSLRADVASLRSQLAAYRAEMAEVRRIAFQGGQDAASVRRELLAYLEGRDA